MWFTGQMGSEINRKLEDTRMKIVIINGSARKGNTLTAINAFIKGVLQIKVNRFFSKIAKNTRQIAE